ncbi:MAG: EF-Tu/IF-2/RF-3 family GTPase, partial [Pseudomonadota bacterium]
LNAEKNNEKFLGIVFKLMNDPFVGSIAFIRVYSGKISKGDMLYNISSDKSKKEKVSRILEMSAIDKKDINEAKAGDIVAFTSKTLTTGNTLSSEDTYILEKLFVPDPVISMSIEPKKASQQEKMLDSLTRIGKEDASFQMSVDFNGQVIVAGMGELHLEIILDRLQREFNVEVNVGQPQVAYKSAISKEIDKVYELKKQTGGAGQYAKIHMRILPMTKEEMEADKDGKGYLFVNEIKGGVIPSEYIPAIEKGIVQGAKSGILVKGCVMVNYKVVLYFGKTHEVDSNSLAFETAAREGIREGMKEANPYILEPIMKVETTTPEEQGTVISDLSKRRGVITVNEDRDGASVITADVPLANMFKYASTLRSITKGRATYTMEFTRYEKVPMNIQQEIIENK